MQYFNAVENCMSDSKSFLAEMSDLLGINASTASRRYVAAKRRLADDERISEAVANVIRQYEHKA